MFAVVTTVILYVSGFVFLYGVIRLAIRHALGGAPGPGRAGGAASVRDRALLRENASPATTGHHPAAPSGGPGTGVLGRRPRPGCLSTAPSSSSLDVDPVGLASPVVSNPEDSMEFASLVKPASVRSAAEVPHADRRYPDRSPASGRLRTRGRRDGSAMRGCEDRTRDGNAEDRTGPHPPRPARPAGRGAIAQWPADAPVDVNDVLVAPIDADLADTAAFCAAYEVGLDESANCVVVAGKREGEVRYAACMVLATTRADVNGVVRRAARRAQGELRADGRGGRADRHGVRRHHPDRPAGGVADPGRRARCVADAAVIIGSGIRGSKIALPGPALGALPGAQVVEGLARPA